MVYSADKYGGTPHVVEVRCGKWGNRQNALLKAHHFVTFLSTGIKSASAKICMIENDQQFEQMVIGLLISSSAI